jgi:hypothetical protein
MGPSSGWRPVSVSRNRQGGEECGRRRWWPRRLRGRGGVAAIVGEAAAPDVLVEEGEGLGVAGKDEADAHAAEDLGVREVDEDVPDGPALGAGREHGMSDGVAEGLADAFGAGNEAGEEVGGFLGHLGAVDSATSTSSIGSPGRSVPPWRTRA